MMNFEKEVHHEDAEYGEIVTAIFSYEGSKGLYKATINRNMKSGSVWRYEINGWCHLFGYDGTFEKNNDINDLMEGTDPLHIHLVGGLRDE